MTFPGRWWHQPTPQDGKIAYASILLLPVVHVLWSRNLIIFVHTIIVAFWLSWVSLACTIVAAIGGIIGFTVSKVIGMMSVA